VRGIFAIGVVRSGSVKRVGSAIGEAAAVVPQIHSFFANRKRLEAVMRPIPSCNSQERAAQAAWSVSFEKEAMRKSGRACGEPNAPEPLCG